MTDTAIVILIAAAWIATLGVAWFYGWLIGCRDVYREWAESDATQTKGGEGE